VHGPNKVATTLFKTTKIMEVSVVVPISDWTTTITIDLTLWDFTRRHA